MCPICKSTQTTRVLGDREIHITRDDVKKRVGADLTAFRCQEGHVFFLLSDDLRKEDRAG
jgi:hypothetical protein